MTFGHIMGRLTAYIEDPSLEKSETVAQWYPCHGEDFDIIWYNPNFLQPAQALLHEEFHGVLNRIGAHQAELSEDLEEMIVEALSVHVIESYHIRRR